MAGIGKIQFTAGTEALPAITFGDDTDTGWYLSAVGDVRLSVAASDALRVTADAVVVESPQLVAQSGTEAAPAITFEGDQDSGMYRTGANGLALTVGGSRALQVASDLAAQFFGNLTVDQVLRVEGTASFDDRVRFDSGIELFGSQVIGASGDDLATGIEVFPGSIIIDVSGDAYIACFSDKVEIRKNMEVTGSNTLTVTMKDMNLAQMSPMITGQVDASVDRIPIYDVEAETMKYIPVRELLNVDPT